MIRAYRFELYTRVQLEATSRGKAAELGRALAAAGNGRFRRDPNAWGEDYATALWPMDPTPEPADSETLYSTGGEFIPAVLR